MATGGDAPIQITSKAYQEFLLHQQRLFQGYSRRRRSSSFEDITTPVETAEDVMSSAAASMSIIRPVKKTPKVNVTKGKRKRGRPRIKREPTDEQNATSKARVILAVSNPNPVLLIGNNENPPFPQSTDETGGPRNRDSVSREKSRQTAQRENVYTSKLRQSAAKISSKKGPKTKSKTTANKGKASTSKNKTPASQSKASTTRSYTLSLRSKASATPVITPSQQKRSGQSAKKRSADSGVCSLKFASKALNYTRDYRNS